jgi:LmbE family N-acetylglucosaminyl deacetylase
MNILRSRRQRSERTRVGVDEAAAALVGPGDTVLTIWSRPDDETLFAGAVVAANERMGARVVRAYATGTSPTAHSVTLFPDADRAVALLPRTQGVRAVQRMIETYAPDVVLTLDADGVTGDPDRRAVARWVARALKSADPGGRIAHVVVDVAARWPEELVQRMHLADLFWPGFPVRRTAGIGCDVLLGHDELSTKLAGLEETRSAQPLQRRLGASDLGRLAAIEAYRAVNDRARTRLAALDASRAIAA